MTLVFYAEDNEFGSATGENVDVTENTSEFDDPPSDSTNLQIAANEGDDDPRLFEIGDTYDVSWNTPDGPLMMEDAVVVRSDAAPGGGGVIVFEGTDQHGNPAQVIWTPDFDLQQWYDDAGGGDPDAGQPQFYTQDTNSSYSHSFVCFAAGTQIETPNGPRRVEDLRPHDLVLTLDAGPQPILWTGERRCPGAGRDAPIQFDPGVLDNTRPLLVSPQHRVLLRSPLAEMTHGTSEVLVPAKAMLGCPGVRATPLPSVRYVHLLLRDHHVIRAGGALCETLLLGPQTRAMCRAAPGFGSALRTHGLCGVDARPARPILRPHEVQWMLPALMGHAPLAMARAPGTPARFIAHC